VHGETELDDSALCEPGDELLRTLGLGPSLDFPPRLARLVRHRKVEMLLADSHEISARMYTNTRARAHTHTHTRGVAHGRSSKTDTEIHTETLSLLPPRPSFHPPSPSLLPSFSPSQVVSHEETVYN